MSSQQSRDKHVCSNAAISARSIRVHHFQSQEVPMPGLRGEAAIVGVAEFAPSRKPEKLWMGLEAYSELARMALDDAGLTIRDVDAVLTGNNLQEAQMFIPATVIEYLGIESHFSEVVDLGGASGAGLVLRAAMAIEMGLCETALCM